MTFYAAACQTDFPCPSTRAEIADRTRGMCAMGEQTVVAANQGAQLAHYPPFSWPGGSMIVDHDGRILAQADPGPGEKVVVAPIDIAVLRAERERRVGHDMRAHLRSEAHTYLARPWFDRSGTGALNRDSIEKRIRDAKRQLAK